MLVSGTAAGQGIGCPAAGKTGTTSSFTDAWFVGFTPKLSTAVWVGYPKETTSMTAVPGYGEVFGGTLPAPIWHEYMSAAKGRFCGDFPAPKHRSSPRTSMGASRAAMAAGRAAPERDGRHRHAGDRHTSRRGRRPPRRGPPPPHGDDHHRTGDDGAAGAGAGTGTGATGSPDGYSTAGDGTGGGDAGTGGATGGTSPPG